MKIEYKINHEQFSQENKADLVIINGEIFTYKNTGLTRRVFVNDDKTKVVKIPVYLNSFDFNTEENECWVNASENVKSEMANTQILDNGYIIQEFLHTLDDENTEEWLGRDMSMKEISFAKSCRNDVGYDENGKLKCFDLNENLIVLDFLNLPRSHKILNDIINIGMENLIYDKDSTNVQDKLKQYTDKLKNKLNENLIG